MANLMLKFFVCVLWMNQSIGLTKSKDEAECYLPDGCQFIESLANSQKRSVRILCQNLNAHFDTDRFRNTLYTCITRKLIHFNTFDTYVELFIKPDSKKRVILDNSIQILKLKGLTEYYYYYNLYFISKFIGLDGFSLDSSFNSSILGQVFFYKTKFSFYNRAGQQIRSCEDFLNPSLLDSTNFNYHVDYINFMDVEFGKPICELLFRDCFFSNLKLGGMANTYFKTNLLRFTPSMNQSMKWNFTIVYALSLVDFFEIDLDTNLLNENVYAGMNELNLYGKLNSIQNDLFEHFTHVYYIELDPMYFLDICRRQGIGWLKSMNSHLNISLSNHSEVRQHGKEKKLITFSDERESSYDKTFQIIYDEDFCLFMDFPFNQLVIFQHRFFMAAPESCIVKWLQMYTDLINFYISGYWPSYDNFSDYVTTCNADKRIKLCNKTQFTYKKSSDQSQTTLNFMIVSEFLVILFTPLISLVGVILNSIVIAVIVKKENRKELKERQYTYMAVHSAINIAICLLNILSLMNECQLPFGIYCSSIRQLVFFQYFKIIFGEYFNSFFRLMSNFTYVAFAFNRVSLVGQDHNFLTIFMADVGIKKYIAASFVISGGLSVVKALQFEVNLVYPEYAYPVMFDENPENPEWNSKTHYKLVLIFNVVYGLINYVLFIVINFLVDILLIVKLRQALREREEKFKEQSEKVKEKLKTENKEAFRKVLTMVLLNSSISLLLKIPIVITSLNDLRIITSASIIKNMNFILGEYRRWFSFPYTMKFFCSWDRICEIFRSFGNFLYLTSLSLNFLFLRSYDKKFALAFEQTLFFKRKSASTVHS